MELYPLVRSIKIKSAVVFTLALLFNGHTVAHLYWLIIENASIVSSGFNDVTTKISIRNKCVVNNSVMC